jgi:hypothetical protein
VYKKVYTCQAIKPENPLFAPYNPVNGKEPDVYMQEQNCRKKLKENGHEIIKDKENANWFLNVMLARALQGLMKMEKLFWIFAIISNRRHAALGDCIIIFLSWRMSRPLFAATGFYICTRRSIDRV